MKFDYSTKQYKNYILRVLQGLPRSRSKETWRGVQESACHTTTKMLRYGMQFFWISGRNLKWLHRHKLVSHSPVVVAGPSPPAGSVLKSKKKEPISINENATMAVHCRVRHSTKKLLQYFIMAILIVTILLHILSELHNPIFAHQILQYNCRIYNNTIPNTH